MRGRGGVTVGPRSPRPRGRRGKPIGPRRQVRIRVQVSAAHNDDKIEAAIAAFVKAHAALARSRDRRIPTNGGAIAPRADRRPRIAVVQQ